MEIWERLDNESPLMFSRFVVYRDMGLTRSLKRVSKVVGVALDTIKGNSTAHEWVLRARAYDREVDRVRLAANAEAQVEMILRHARLGQETVALARDALRTLKVEDLKPGDVVRLLELGVKVERLSRGAPTEHVATSDGDPLTRDEATGEDLAAEFKGFLAGLEAANATDQEHDPSTEQEVVLDAGEVG